MDQLEVSNIHLMRKPQEEHWGNGIKFSKIEEIQESSDLKCTATATEDK